ncbi:pilus assembly protein N-terminal domain-containing protein [Methylobrevis albus]|uniref:Pilus assembly protein N-terminal domain-containing protein n=1 Tax=Methylobrevis albus TaxID=2793297 RepID=A0A931I195_9HYPH|nr:pilus assembly protein N-terminal domain-containing protein [Methylobrevis albus]MBH0238457.1 pilus assembly protein N-terminal domain-containing protein [Methylobrevis albus]
MLPHAIRIAFAGFALAATALPAAADDTVVVNIDQAKVMHISAPAQTVIIGNPSIADATMQDSQTLVITGRGYGTTNFIVLGTDGTPVADAQVRVEGEETNLVTVFRQGQGNRASLSCGNTCEPMLRAGDNVDLVFDPLLKSLAGRNGHASTGGGIQ